MDSLVVLHPAAAPHIAAAQPPLLPRLLGVLTAAQAAGAEDKPAGAASLMLDVAAARGRGVSLPDLLARELSA